MSWRIREFVANSRVARAGTACSLARLVAAQLAFYFLQLALTQETGLMNVIFSSPLLQSILVFAESALAERCKHLCSPQTLLVKACAL